MAWSLSNNALIKRGKKTLALDPKSTGKSLGEKVIQMMRRLLGFTSNKVFDHIRFNTKIIMGTKVSQNYRGSRSTYYQEFNEAVDPTSAEEARKLTLQQLFTNK